MDKYQHVIDVEHFTNLVCGIEIGELLELYKELFNTAKELEKRHILSLSNEENLAARLKRQGQQLGDKIEQLQNDNTDCYLKIAKVGDLMEVEGSMPKALAENLAALLQKITA